MRTEPLPLPKGYEWCTPDINVDDEVSPATGERRGRMWADANWDDVTAGGSVKKCRRCCQRTMWKMTTLRSGCTTRKSSCIGQSDAPLSASLPRDVVADRHGSVLIGLWRLPDTSRIGTWV